VIPSNWRLRGDPRPALWRGLLVAAPVGIAALVELELKTPSTGAITIGASITGFVAFDAPARTRFWWQLGVAPPIGVAASLGALTGDSAVLAVTTMALCAGVGAMSRAVSPRAAIAAINFVLTLLIAQGLSLEVHDTPRILALGAAGALAQALLSLIVALPQGGVERPHPLAGLRSAVPAVRSNLNLRSPVMRHALRSAGALAVAVGAYHVVDFGIHGYWIPLTVLFVLTSDRAQTYERIWMRAAGTAVGLAVATGLAILIGHHIAANVALLTVASAVAYAMLRLEYALFTFAITIYIVTISHAMGESAVDAVGERALGTAIGIGIVILAFGIWRDRPATASTAPT
jgi:Fusaric acid resistance protein-like